MERTLAGAALAGAALAGAALAGALAAGATGGFGGVGEMAAGGAAPPAIIMPQPSATRISS